MKNIFKIFCCTLLFILVPGCDRHTQDFIPHDYDQFSIAMPAQQPQILNETTIEGQLSSIKAESHGVRYLLIYWEIPDNLIGLTNVRLLEMMLAGEGKWSETKTKEPVLSGLPAREFEGTSTKGTYALTRLLRTRDRVYLLTVAGPETLSGARATRKFFESFHLHNTL